MPKMVERKEDMSPHGYIRVIRQDDGDMILVVIPDPEHPSSIFGNTAEFCMPFTGGGKSPHTIVAIRNLMEAMERDNKETPAGDPNR